MQGGSTTELRQLDSLYLDFDNGEQESNLQCESGEQGMAAQEKGKKCLVCAFPRYLKVVTGNHLLLWGDVQTSRARFAATESKCLSKHATSSPAATP